MTLPPERQQLMGWINHAVHSGARLRLACQEIGLTPRTVQRWRQHDSADGRTTAKKVPANKLSVPSEGLCRVLINSNIAR